MVLSKTQSIYHHLISVYYIWNPVSIFFKQYISNYHLFLSGTQQKSTKVTTAKTCRLHVLTRAPFDPCTPCRPRAPGNPYIINKKVFVKVH